MTDRAMPTPRLQTPEERVTETVRMLLDDLVDAGCELSEETMENTPGRIARAYLNELLAGYHQDPEEILSPLFEVPHDEMISVTDIPFYSLCEHHMLPFVGVAHLAYIPDGRIVGLSKVGRIVDCFARRLQIQETLVTQVADAFMEYVKPKGVAVAIDAEHTCMTMRGVQKPGSRTVTDATRGCFNEGRCRVEFQNLIERKRS